MLRFLLVLLFINVSTLQFPPSHQIGSQANEVSSESIGIGYKFENPRFYIPLIEIDLSPDGTGVLRFKRGEFDEVIDLEIKPLPATISRIRSLLTLANFLDSDDEYQDKKDFSHLGWVSISAREAGRERTVRFNYTTRQDVKEIAEILRGLATQAIHLFDIELAAKHQPLDLPRVLSAIESDLRLERLSEPLQLLEALREIHGNDTLPLIARNHASRLIAGIEKGKYKTPLKSGK